MTYTPELYALTIITTLIALMWVPYVLARLGARGLLAMANVDPGVPPEPLWADRARRAHANAIENLAVFAPLVLVAAAIGLSNPTTVACLASLRRIAHLAHYFSVRCRNPLCPHGRLLRRSLRNSDHRCEPCCFTQHRTAPIQSGVFADDTRDGQPSAIRRQRAGEKPVYTRWNALVKCGWLEKPHSSAICARVSLVGGEQCLCPFDSQFLTE